MNIRLISIATFLLLTYGDKNVLRCPFEERGWKIRQNDFKCQEDLTYHCLLDLNDRSVEACLRRKEYQREGCPWVLETDEGAFFGEPLTSCKNKRYCPIGDESFYTNQLYLHPACLVAVEERLNFSPPDVTYHEYSTRRSTSGSPNEIRQTDTNVYNNLTFVIVGLIFSLVVIVVLVMIFILKRRREYSTCTFTSRHTDLMCRTCLGRGLCTREDMNETHTRRRKNDQLRDTWNLRETIKKGDDPEKVHDNYMLIENIGERNYKKYLPKYKKKSVSYLIFAAKHNRKETVLYFLQRCLDGSHIFLQDTYGVDSHDENIMLLAIRRGWTDVVEKLLTVDGSHFNNDAAMSLAISLQKKDIIETLTRNKMT